MSATFGTIFLSAAMIVAAHLYKKEREVRPDKRFDESCKALGLPTQQEIKAGTKVKLPHAPQGVPLEDWGVIKA